MESEEEKTEITDEERARAHSATFLRIDNADGEPMPLSWFVALQDLFRDVAKFRGYKNWKAINLTICSAPFDPDWKRSVDARLKALDVANDGAYKEPGD